MDYFETGVSYDTLTRRLNEVHTELSKKYNGYALFFILLWFMVGGLVTGFVIQGNDDFIFLLPIGITLLFILFTVVIAKSALKKKIVNTHLNKEVVSLYNFTEGTDVNYLVKPDFYKDFNKDMALYTRNASPSCQYTMSSKNPELLNFQILRVSLITSNGKSSTVHFDGHYLIIDFPTKQHFHIRDRKQRNNRKGLKFYKVPNEEFHIYLSEDDYDNVEKRVIRHIDRQYISLYSFAKEVFKTEKLSIGSNKEQLHFAIGEKIKFKMPNEFTYDNVKEYYDQFVEVIQGANQIIKYVKEMEQF